MTTSDDADVGIAEGVHAATRAEAPRLLVVWEAAVRTTHRFLTDADIDFFRPLVVEGVFGLEHVTCVRDTSGLMIGFAGVSAEALEALFVHPDWHGRGVGRRLVSHAIENLGARRVEVNEQNEQAVAFYRRVGFRVVGRSDRDAFGRPFPLLHMQL